MLNFILYYFFIHKNLNLCNGNLPEVEGHQGCIELFQQSRCVASMKVVVWHMSVDLVEE